MKKGNFQYSMYILLLCLYVFFRIFSSTYLINFFSNLVTIESMINYICCFGLFFVFILHSKIKVRKIVVSIIIFLVTLIASYYSADKSIIITCLFIIAYPQGIELKKIAKSIFKISILLIGITLSFMLLDKIPDYISVQHGVSRHSLGFVAPNAFSNIVTLNVMLWYFYNDSKKTFKSGFFILTLLFIVYHFTNSRLALLIGVLDVIFSIYIDTKKSDKVNNFFFFLAKYLIGFFGIICVVATMFFSNHRAMPIYSKIDTVMTGRLSWMIYYYNNYGIDNFGNKIASVSKITAVKTGAKWANLDNSYILFSIKYGLIFLYVFIILYFILGKQLRRKDDLKSALYVILISIFGLTESILFVPGFNFSLLFIAEMISDYKRKNVILEER